MQYVEEAPIESSSIVSYIYWELCCFQDKIVKQEEDNEYAVCILSMKHRYDDEVVQIFMACAFEIVRKSWPRKGRHDQDKQASYRTLVTAMATQ